MARKLLRLLTSLSIGASLIACTRATEDLGGGVKIKIPSAEEFYGNGNQSLASIDYSKLCFAVHVTGVGIQNSSGPICSWKFGRAVGYVKPTETLVIDDLPKNNSLTFEIYGYLRGSTSDPCVEMPEVITQNELERTYFLGKTVKTLLSQSENVAITLSLPDSDSHLGKTIALAASCPAKGVTPIASPVPSSASFILRNSRIAPGMAASATSFKAVGRVMGGSAQSAPTSSNFKVQ